MNLSGIYKIQSVIKPERVYIGSAIDISSRWRNHINSLKNKKHRNIKLQRHFNKYGEGDLVFKIILSCDKEDLLKVEQYFIDSYNPFFNICKVAGSNYGRKFSKKVRDKISKANKGRKISESHKRKISEANKGKKRTAEMREKLRLSHIGKNKYKHTEEHKKKVSEKMKGKKAWTKGFNNKYRGLKKDNSLDRYIEPESSTQDLKSRVA